MDGAAIQSLVRTTLTKDGAADSQNARPVLVKADQSVRYGDVVTIMTLLQQAGAASVGLVTEEGKPMQQSVDHSGNAWRSA